METPPSPQVEDAISFRDYLFCMGIHILAIRVGVREVPPFFWRLCVSWLLDSFSMAGRRRGASAHPAHANGRLYLYSLF